MNPGGLYGEYGMLAPYMGINNVVNLASISSPWKAKPVRSKFACPEREKTEIPPDTSMWTLWFIGLTTDHAWATFSLNRVPKPSRNAVILETIADGQASVTKLLDGKIAFPHPSQTCNVLMAGGNVMSVTRKRMPVDYDNTFWKARSPKYDNW